MKLNHISHSQFSAYMSCPAKYYFRYCKGLVIPPKSALVFGSATHISIKANNNYKKEHGEEEKLSVLQDVFEAHILKEPEIDFKEGEKKETLIDEGTHKIIPLYYRQLAPKVQPKIVEEKFEVKFNNADWTLQGVLDLMDIDFNVRDYKTTGKTPSAKEPLIPNIQLTLYALGVKTLFGKLPNRLYLDYLIRTKEPKVLSSPEGTRTLKDIDIALKLVAYIVKQIEDEIFYPNLSNYQCNSENCGYYNFCKREWGSL